MQKDSVNILCTRPLDALLIEQAATANILIDQLSLLATKPVKDKKLKQVITSLAAQPVPIAITSINAAKAVAAFLESGTVAWKIFTIGTATRDFISAFFGSNHIAGVAEHAAALGDLILRAGVKELYFFCGDQRRDELPQKLADAQVQVHELVVYNSIYTAEKIEKYYDGILFFSPGAVQSFFSVNLLPPATVLFAIGATTAESIHTHSSNPVVVAEQPAAAALIDKMIAYFTHTSITHERKK
ncbi:MAG: uroporphyrinogen-III synthase [Williamsia sp.]|nr:uroporphyrinogen-III synthase [Williamsia sp.]